MTPQEARQILLLYRPGTADDADPEIAAAIQLAESDPELGRWFEEHKAFQLAMRSKLHEVQPPAALKAALLRQQPLLPKVVPHSVWWRSPLTLAAAAALIVAGLVILWQRAPQGDSLANFQSRMIRSALREYRMDIVTNDMQQVRQYMADRGAPSDYEISGGLDRLTLTGGGLMRWRNHPVAMVCFNRGDDQMLYLFVMDRAALKDAPGAMPQLGKTATLLTAIWTRGDKIYLLAGPQESDFEKKYLPPKS